jgi:hypothetical protein
MEAQVQLAQQLKQQQQFSEGKGRSFSEKTGRQRSVEYVLNLVLLTQGELLMYVAALP